ncbi:non-ribosomal peptide synthetase [Scytonema sp. PCC 10023]|uniref:non-ribosomal peptide synthetase n=1 Tax=Scytonema sp. PCC 10023 TaxID=1680591 RepID=UPI0039C5CC72
MKKEKMECYRLSPQQKHLWLWHKDSLIYRSVCAVIVEGELKKDIVSKALQKVVARHEILRTTFRLEPESNILLQVISNNNSLSFNVIDLSHENLEKQEQEAKLEELFREQRQILFHFEQELPLHIHLYVLSRQKHILLVSLPFLCADTWTFKNLIREISCHYATYLHGNKPLGEVIQYADYSELQNELIETESTKLGREYWSRNNLKDFPELILPGEGKLFEKPVFSPDSLSVMIDSASIAKIDTIVQKYNTSTFVLLLSCWYILLYRFTEQQDIIINTLFHGRNYKALHSALGLFTRWLPIHCHLENDVQFTEVLEKVNQAILEVYECQGDLSWEEQLGETQNAFAHSSLPICFEFEDLSLEYLDSNVSFCICRHYSPTGVFKVKISCVRLADSFLVEIYYDTALFQFETIKHLAENFETTLKNIIDNQDTSVSRLNILSAAEQHQILVEWNDTSANYPKNVCICELFEAQVERTPDAVAVVFEQEQLTYRELNCRANQLAHYLRTLCVGPEVLVGICMERSLEMVVGILGILKAGGVYVPLDPLYPKEHLAFILADTQVSVLVTQQRLVKKLPNYEAQVVCLDTSWEDIAGLSRENPANGVMPENLVYVVYTSGSTGKPKGIGMSHLSLTNLLNWHFAKLSRGTRTLQFASMSFDNSFHEIFSTWCSGGTLFLISKTLQLDVAGLARFLLDTAVEKLILPVVVLQQLAQEYSSQEQLYINFKDVVSTGEQLQVTTPIIKLFKRLPNSSLQNQYGPSESHVVTTYTLESIPDCWSTHPSIGRPIANTQIYLLDQHLNPVPIGVPGELHIGGVSLARGYLNRPDLTAEKFIPNPFSNEPCTRLYKTGDLARYLPDGSIEYLGRLDHQIKIRGFRIEPQEIEMVLSQHPTVRQNVVILREDIIGCKRLVAYVVPNEELTPTASELYSFLKQKLLEYMIPSAYIMLDALPLTLNGKVDRRALPVPEIARPELSKAFVAPRTPVEESITEIWAQVLGLTQVGIYDNFFELGGHSLLATQVISRVRDAFQVELPVRSILETPTVEGLALAVTQLQVDREDVQVDRESDGEIIQIMEELKHLSEEDLENILNELM